MKECPIKLVSVIIPCFNAEKYIDRAVESVFNQDWPRVELIVVNDASTDSSAEHVLAWKNKFIAREGYELHYVNQGNTGVGGAVETALKYVTGDYLTLLDADDRYLPESISVRANFLNAHPEFTMVRSNGYIVSEKNRWLFTYDAAEKTGNVFEMLMHGKTYNWAGTYMVRTKILLDYYKIHPFYPSRFGQNLQIMIPVAFQGECGYVDKPLMEYFRTEQSFTREVDFYKRKEKSIRNAAGFLDIRRSIIAELPIEEREKNDWNRIAEAIYQRLLLRIGLDYEDKALAKQALCRLMELGEYTIEDRISYCARYRKTASLFWRGIKKVRKISSKQK